MPESNVAPAIRASKLQIAPRLLDVLRGELRRVLDMGRSPIKLLVHGGSLPALYASAKEEGVFEDESPNEILGMPVMLSDLVPAEEGARIVCQGDDTHALILRRRAAIFADAECRVST